MSEAIEGCGDEEVEEGLTIIKDKHNHHHHHKITIHHHHHHKKKKR